MASWDPSATQSVNALVAGSGITLSPSSGQGIVTITSSGGGGGVSAIVAGTNVTISPTSGLGTVTVNSAGGWNGNAATDLNLYTSSFTRKLGSVNFVQPTVQYGTGLTGTTSPYTLVLPLPYTNSNFVANIMTSGTATALAVWATSNLSPSTCSLAWTGVTGVTVPFSYTTFGV